MANGWGARDIERCMKSMEAFIAMLHEIGDGDSEEGHEHAERILCSFLRLNGYEDLAEAFEETKKRVEFWYS